jgi:small subunit ribosomal protein S16
MLAIRLQRTGRSGHAQFRLIVQDSRFSPTRGRVVSYLGNYNPHTKTANIDSEKAAKYLQNGAQPSDAAARLLKKEGIKLPTWVKLDEPKKRKVRNPEKRRSTAPAKPESAEPKAEEPAAVEEPAEETSTPAEETEVAEPAAPETESEPADLPAETENASESSAENQPEEKA